MNCPVCNKILAPTLSICTSCGAMMNDSIREELKNKVSPANKTTKTEIGENYSVSNKLNPTVMSKPQMPVSMKPQIPASLKPVTMEISPKPTNPTLVDFQPKNAALPEWRLQIQNAVRKRRENAQVTDASEQPKSGFVQRVLPTNGSAALQAEYVEQQEFPVNEGSPIAGALRRIEQSRRQFLIEEIETPPPPPIESESPAPKNYPFYIATKNAEVLPKPPEVKNSVNFTELPKIADLPIIEKKDLDTNKLRNLPNSGIISTNLKKVATDEISVSSETETPVLKLAETFDGLAETEMDGLEIEETDEEFEDFAPFSARVNAGLFDLILGSFVSLVLLAPIMISGGNWLSIMGFLAFMVTCSIVMFIYLTTTIGFFGQTLGMKMFSLETIDIQENDYPTLHQAAVSSSVYLLSLAFGGIGFIPALFNEEKRTASDLLSGTMIVREEE